jgi:dienelactone hydrolase
VSRNEKYAIYRVWFRATPELHTYGLLLVPHAATASTPAPALICVHGMGGSPEQAAGLVPRPDYLRAFGARAAERGFVVFAPLMSKRTPLKSRLDRKANLLGTRLQGIEQGKVLRAVDYLETLPEVARDRIGIYGISWGGRTALYAGALDERLAAVAVSGHFNETVPKMVQASTHYTAYIDTLEDYAFFYNLANTFSDADLGSLICPRPIFIEQGSRDRVAWVEMARREFGRLKFLYRRLGVEERAEMGVFEGEHFVYGDDAFRFFEKWLKPATTK